MIYCAKMPEAWARIEWCRQAFGESGTWWRSKGYVCFKNKQEYMWYQLRWA